MWCTSSDSSNGRSVPSPHHRIVRIPPGEAVVLNSAERAPYLLLIEILNDDLDFDPSKRPNKDILRKVVTKEVEQRGGWSDFGVSSGATRKDAIIDPSFSSRALLPLPFPDSSTTFVDDDEEIDLVEQLYGDDQPLRSRVLDIEESIILPPTPKNKELDMVTWARSSPLVPQPYDDQRPRPTPLAQSFTPQSISRANSASPSISQISQSDSDTPHMLSLDEYSERMRTAAIMLAQLNADSGRDPLPVPQKLNGASRSDSAISRSGALTYIHRNLTLLKQGIGRQGSNEVSQPLYNRMRLPRAEAAAIRDRIMKEMNALEEERMERMKGTEGEAMMRGSVLSGSSKSAEDEGIIRRELNKVDPSAVVFSESWAAKKVRCS